MRRPVTATVMDGIYLWKGTLERPDAVVRPSARLTLDWKVASFEVASPCPTVSGRRRRRSCRKRQPWNEARKSPPGTTFFLSGSVKELLFSFQLPSRLSVLRVHTRIRWTAGLMVVVLFLLTRTYH